MPTNSLLTRRRLVGGLVAIVAAGSGLLARFTGAAHAAGESVPVSELMAEGPLPDVSLGAKDAPVTIVEYASMTCPHCARFAAETFPALKAKYMDTGKVRYILREFPLDALATAGFMLMRCAGPDKREAMTDLLFSQQKNWAFAKKPLEDLANVVKQAGFTQAAFESCLKDQKLYTTINSARDSAADKFHVDATPTFFVNGKRLSGEVSLDELSRTIDPMLPK
jgi:protein-disulfide isomerase